MDSSIGNLISAGLSKLLSSLKSFGLADPFSLVLQIGQKLIGERSSDGIYEVLDYESTLEIHDVKGTKATFSSARWWRWL